MLIGKKLKQIRESKNLSQGDIEKRTGLIRSYSSRVENGHVVPSVETLEKYAGALDIPLYRLFYEGDEPPKHLIRFPADGGATQIAEMVPLAKAVARLDEQDRRLLVAMANQMARKHARKVRKGQG
jgi:transcriptional regulator with XRE-family HTH domain